MGLAWGCVKAYPKVSHIEVPKLEGWGPGPLPPCSPNYCSYRSRESFFFFSWLNCFVCFVLPTLACVFKGVLCQTYTAHEKKQPITSYLVLRKQGATSQVKLCNKWGVGKHDAL